VTVTQVVGLMWRGIWGVGHGVHQGEKEVESREMRLGKEGGGKGEGEWEWADS